MAHVLIKLCDFDISCDTYFGNFLETQLRVCCHLVTEVGRNMNHNTQTSDQL